MQAINPAFDQGAKFDVGNGRSIRFWLHFWVGPRPLWEEFLDLYVIAVHPNLRVAEALASPLPPAISFCRTLPAQESAWLGA